MASKPSLPAIQRWMRTLADELDENGLRNKAKWLRRLTTLISRVKSIRRAPSRYPMPTPAKVVAVRRYMAANPDASYKFVSNKFGVGNDGRMSEIMRGKRGSQVYDALGRVIRRRWS